MAIYQIQKIMSESPDHARKLHDDAYSGGSAFVNGKFLPIGQAAVPITDTGFMHADAAYDVVTVSKGAFFRLDDHLARMERSCEKFQLNSPYNRPQTADILQELVRLTGYQDAYVWWSVTRGALSGGRSDPSAYKGSFYAFVLPYLSIADDEKRTTGMDLNISKKYIRIPANAVDPTAKNFHWLDMKLSLFEAHGMGMDWSVLTDDSGYLTEAPGANIFLINNKVVSTPALGCLQGLTRQSVLDIAKELGLETYVGAIHADELLKADEVFICTSAGGICPVATVDGVLLHPDRVGPGTAAIHDTYWQKRWDGWHATPVKYT